MAIARPLASQIVTVFLGLLLVVLTAVGALSHWVTSTRHAQEVEQSLNRAVMVVQRQLAYQRSQLESTVAILTNDFGFRDALVSHDAATILSALENHSARIAASVAAVWSLEGKLVAYVDIAASKTTSDTDLESLNKLAHRARLQGPLSALITIDQRLLQVVVVAVRAPLPVAWVALGFAIDDAKLEELGSLTGLAVSLAEKDQQQRWRLAASSLDEATRPLMASTIQSVSPPWTGEDDAGFVSRMVPAIPGETPATTALIVGRPLDEAYASYFALQKSLAGIAIGSVMLFWAGSRFLSRRITKPLANLTRATSELQHGDYATEVAIDGSSETQALTESFNRMIEAVRERERRVRQLAYEDATTGLANRAAFTAHLDQLLEHVRQNSGDVAVIVLDIDRFSGINDTLGYPVGDQVLRSVAERLRHLARKGDFIGRLGADVFALALPDTDGLAADAAAKRIQKGMQEPLLLDNQPLDIVLSIGFAVAPEDGLDAVPLKRAAELAKQHAKRSGGHYLRYHSGLDRSRREHLSLIGELRRAMEHDQLELHYQPKVCLATGGVNAVEALMRWRHPDRGMVAPGDFIPFAEHTGYIKALTRWVLMTAMRQIADWHGSGIHLLVAVNVSARDLTDPELIPMIERQLALTGIPPQLLGIEVTESGMMEDLKIALDNLNALDQFGVRLAIDDFGTGYSSLAYLKRLPVDELKIDQAFIRQLPQDAEDALIVRSTIELGHNLGLTVTAEGVENFDTLQQLRAWNCDLAQGYYVSRPLPSSQLLGWLRDRGDNSRSQSHQKAKVVALPLQAHSTSVSEQK